MTGLVLIAEHDPFSLRLLAQLVEEAGIDVITAGDAETALNNIARHRPTVIVLDSGLTHDDGRSVLSVLQAEPQLATIPVLLCVPHDDEEARRRGLELGASDILARPFRVYEVEIRVRNLIRLAAAEQAAKSARDAMEPSGLNDLDALTRAGSEGQLRITLEYEATRAVRYGHPLTCLVLRVTNFAAITEHGGDNAGQGLLLQLASNLRRAIRGIDHLFRSERDEFTVLLPETSVDGAQTVISRLREDHRTGALTGPAIEPAPQMELGVAAISRGGRIDDGERLFLAARGDLKPL